MMDWKKKLGIGVTILLFVLIILSRNHLRVPLDVDGVQGIIHAFGGGGVAVYIFINIIRPFIFVPTPILFLSGGLLYGTLWGSIYTLIGLMLGASLCFLLGGRFEGLFKRMIGENLIRKLYGVSGSRGIKTLFTMRVTPGFPFDPISYGAGLVGMDFKSFFIGTLIGITPKLVLYTFLGDRIENLFSVETLGVLCVLSLMALGPHILPKKIIITSLK